MNQQTTGAAAAAPAAATNGGSDLGKIAATALIGAVTAVMTEHLKVPAEEASPLLIGLEALLRRLFGHHIS